MLYHLYELNQAALHPARATAEAYRLLWRNPLNPASHTALGRGAAAADPVGGQPVERRARRPGPTRPDRRSDRTRRSGRRPDRRRCGRPPAPGRPRRRRGVASPEGAGPPGRRE